MDLGQVLYVDKRNAAKPVEMFSSAGKVGPAYCTGVGKAMMAFLDESALEAAIARQSFHTFTPETLDTPAKLKAELTAIRARGYAFDREEHEPGIICCAVPILSRSGRAIGAISVTSTTARTTLAALEAQSDHIKDIAGKIAIAAEDWRFPQQG
jgi:DNA-binding IclR family transcriptional regulator